ncbi:hypothetical protein ACFL54_07415, partial [Planctomycetota bacterium]
IRLHGKVAIEGKEVSALIDNTVRELVDVLVKNQDTDGYIGDNSYRQGHPMGACALSLLALLKAGVAKESKVVQKAMAYLRGLPMQATYSVGLLCMAIEAYYTPLDELAHSEDSITEDSLKKKPRELSAADKKWMAAAADWLVKNQGKSGAWSYGAGGGKRFDNSNAQYGVLGLYAAARCGIRIKAKHWKAILRHWLDCQNKKGKKYTPQPPPGSEDDSSITPVKVRGWDYTNGKSASHSMTCAGAASVAIAYACLYQVNKNMALKFKKSAIASTTAGLGWLEKNYTINKSMKVGQYYYYMYGLERACVINNIRYLGVHNWYREGAIQLCCQSEESGGILPGFPDLPGIEDLPGMDAEKQDFGRWGCAVTVSFVLLFLKKASAPLGAISER